MATKIVMPKLDKELSMSPEIEALINDPVYPTEEQLKDPRIQSLLDEEIH